VALKNSQFDDRLEKCDVLNERLNYLASEYRSKGKAQHNPAAADPDIRKRLNMGAMPFVPTQPSGVYRDSAGDYVYKTPLQNMQAAAAALHEAEPAIKNHPAVAYTSLLCSKALVQQHKATSSTKLVSKPVPSKGVINISGHDGPHGKNPASRRNAGSPLKDNLSHTGSSKQRKEAGGASHHNRHAGSGHPPNPRRSNQTHDDPPLSRRSNDQPPSKQSNHDQPSPSRRSNREDCDQQPSRARTPSP
jgi:hypothetical protein